MTDERLKRRTGGRSEHVRRAVFAAALALYRPGESMPSMAAVAAQAGVQKTTLYRRWGSLEALMHAALADAPRQAIPVPNTGSFGGDMRELARLGHEFIASSEGHRTMRMLIAADEASRQAYWAQRYLALKPIFTRAILRGELPDQVNPGPYLDAIVGSSVFTGWIAGAPEALDSTLGLIDLLFISTRGDL